MSSSEQLLSWLRTTGRRGPTPAWGLHEGQRERADLPEQLVPVVLRGALEQPRDEGPLWFTRYDVLDWVVSFHHATRVPAEFFVPYLDDRDRKARNQAARGLSVCAPSLALAELEARISSKKATDRETGLTLAYCLFTAPDADVTAARALLPRVTDAAAKVKRKGTAAELAVTVLTALASRADHPELPQREDLAVLGSRGAPDANVRARLERSLALFDLPDDSFVDSETLASVTGCRLVLRLSRIAACLSSLLCSPWP